MKILENVELDILIEYNGEVHNRLINKGCNYLETIYAIDPTEMEADDKVVFVIVPIINKIDGPLANSPYVLSINDETVKSVVNGDYPVRWLINPEHLN
ncbi:hypothetical protein C3K47_15580 [Solitalea longa]|uniref:Uncharacterized protein n=1 Tax=Solitalea longa TaxID=2079460 RepID=A0A2S4ZZI2_9SPHI|nr:hypothetical protein [Solitalea longa]POY35479.1 hypothetical protein C3K47_15580 [Solitalea longa]